MGCKRRQFEELPEDSDGLSDEEVPSDDDLDRYGDDEEADVDACPHCGQEAYADADRCGHCGMNVVKGRDPVKGQQHWVRWVFVAAAIALIGFTLTCGLFYWW